MTAVSFVFVSYSIPQFTGTATTVSQVDRLGNLKFISTKSLRQAVDIVVSQYSSNFRPIGCTWPKNCMQLLFVDYSLIASSGYDDDVIFTNSPWRCTFTSMVLSVFHAL